MRAIAVTLAISAAATACVHGHDHGDSCDDGALVRTGSTGAAYCLITCEGAAQDGSFGGTPVDDGIVRPLGGAAYTPEASALPPEVCAKLPHGCRCTTPACTYAHDRERASHDLTRREAFDDGIDPAFAARCRADDRACGAQPFRRTCLDNVFTRADQPIHLVFHDHARELLAAPVDCDSDGECVDSGCGYQCSSTRDHSHRVYTCIGLPGVEEQLGSAACGCFHQHCAWVHR